MDTLLPIEVIQLIFTYVDGQSDLSQCALINKKCNVIVTPLLWRYPYTQHNHNQILASLAQRSKQNPPLGYHVRKLVFHNFETGGSILLMVMQSPFLEELEIQGLHYFRHYSLGRIIRHIPQLRHLMLHNMYFENHNLAFLRRQTLNLIHLNLNHCYDLWSLVALRYCSGLQELELTHCTKITDRVGPNIASLPQLTHLLIDCCRGVYHGLISHFLPISTTLPLPLLISFTFYYDYSRAVEKDLEVALQRTHPLLQQVLIEPRQGRVSRW